MKIVIQIFTTIITIQSTSYLFIQLNYNNFFFQINFSLQRFSIFEIDLYFFIIKN